MGTKEELVLVDSNIFVIDLRYSRDTNYQINSKFLRYLAQTGTGFTTLINLLELCGILSFNLNEQQLLDLFQYFQERYKVVVLPSPDIQGVIPEIPLKAIFKYLSHKMSFGDSLMLAVAARYTPFINTMITWDSAHFKEKFQGQVLTPAEFLAGISKDPV
ncbi:type II toxin-antitoxin system VapC family toxin [candidate division CSSED10-310 bacterium]|uniref:Type II toxin-antitoxin system VapC family toxin n=1 Tax=candidate division CSSED10-310 bacterium TaxID=2855610 RepID=A0ABV6YWQ6_UNCC1